MLHAQDIALSPMMLPNLAGAHAGSGFWVRLAVTYFSLACRYIFGHHWMANAPLNELTHGQQPCRNKNMGDLELDVAECGVSCAFLGPGLQWSPPTGQAVLLDMASQLPLAQLRSLAPLKVSRMGFVWQDSVLFLKGGSGWPCFFDFSFFLLLLQHITTGCSILLCCMFFFGKIYL